MNPCTALCRTLNQSLSVARGGTYIVVLWLNATCELTIGRLGPIRFPRGYYIYVGSAKRGLAARLHRHIHGAATRHWHLDYLRPHARALAWCAFADDHYPECGLARDLLALSQEVGIRFGASDCSCPTHLLYYPHRAHVAQALKRFVRPVSFDDATAWRRADWSGGTRASAPLVQINGGRESGP